MRRLAVVLVLGALGACSSGGGSKPPPDAGTGPGADKDFAIVVGDAKARACQLVLREGLREVRYVTFDASVKGQWSRWKPRAAIAFTARADAPLAKVATLTLTIKGAETAFPALDVTCYDRAGRKLDSSMVTIK